MKRRDYVCLACGERFSRDEPEDGPRAAGSEARDEAGGRRRDEECEARIACPACGSERVREHWESRVRNAGRPPRPLEEMRDRPG